MNTDGIVPAARPQVPITKVQIGSGRADDRIEYRGACRVVGCDWSMAAGIRAAVEEQASYHRHQHVAAHASRVVQDLEALPEVTC